MAAAALVEMERLAEAAAAKTGGCVRLMEVCGTHTMAIASAGMRRLFPKELRMLSGPGCPVCVTSQGDIDLVLALAEVPGVIITTFGDMLKVKGSKGLDLNVLRAGGADVRVVYSPLDAVELAAAEPGREVVFIGVGFETTAPVIAAALVRARKRALKNFSITSFFKLVPPALDLLLSDPSNRISGFLLPGHVSAIIGLEPYRFVTRKYGVPCVVTGFEPLDILAGINMLLAQIVSGKPEVQDEYFRAVPEGGNPAAVKVMEEVFSRTDAAWRAIGVLKNSGLGLARAYAGFDAVRRFKIKRVEAAEPKGCLCGQILLGKNFPPDCPLFAKACSPSSAVGPCMVSSEGACAAWFKYGG
ncbi:MAG: hydrogenase formation protein HypD [Elusimicrobia bacterium RIFOXYA2_FULL_58_8]|nr:MAG: hydrogenase formation protein HypD [Elusimicrobia bacterium RIFOXYA12_FULL_57_11]OGS14863.1 MAG: hydrogenase formation protein HypD [Elusimicrobia bacterium RIFOXYA2_FULL_58_8]